MTTAEARDLLERMTASSVEPELSSEDLDLLADLAHRPDSAGRVISDDDYVDTWDLELAAAEGWRWKAAKLTPTFNVEIDGHRFDRAQMLEHCMAMVEHYEQRITRNVRLV